MIIGPLLGLATATPAAAQEPWWCPTGPGDATGYWFESGVPGYGPSTIYEVDRGTGASNPVGTTSEPVDAVGYNPEDNFFYGVISGTTNVVRIDRWGNLDHLSDLPFERPIAGDFDDQGHWWVINADGEWAEFDLTMHSGQYGQLINSGHTPPPTGRAPGDWSFVESGPSGPGFYGVTDVAGQNAHLVYFDPRNPWGGFVDLGEVANVPSTGVPTDESIDRRGTFTDGYYLYIYTYSTGTTYRIDLHARSGDPLPDDPGPRHIGDGAQCGVFHAATEGKLNVIKRVDGRNVPEDQFSVNVHDPRSGQHLGGLVTQGDQTEAETGPMPIRTGRETCYSAGAGVHPHAGPSRSAQGPGSGLSRSQAVSTD